MARLTVAERETHINQSADDRSAWIVFSDDPVFQRKLDAIGADCVGTVGEGKRYRLDAGQVRFYRRVEMSKSERAKLAARFDGERSETVQLVGVE